jgi:hypothetical protein
MVRTSDTNMRETTYISLVGKPQGKRQLGRPGRRWEDIVTGHKERGYEGMD